MDLQIFADNTAVQGKQIIYPIRVLENAATEDGTIIAFTTENSRSASRDADSTATKDGSIRVPGALEQELSITAILVKGDTKIAGLEQALKDGKKLEVWEVNLAEPITSKTNMFKGTYYQGYATDYELSSNAEDMVEVTMTIGLEGNGATGEVTVTAAQQEAATYVFRDTGKTGA